MLEKIGKLLKTGFFHIVGAGTVNKVISMLLSIVLVRILSKAEYGAYAYAFNIVSFFVLFNGMGAASAILQICSECYKDKANSYAVYQYAFKGGIVVDIAIAVLILVVALFVPLAIDGSNEILVLYCLYPLVSLLCEMRLMRLRVNLENRMYARMTNIQTLLLALFATVGAWLFQTPGLIIGQCLAYCVSYMLLTFVANPNCSTKPPEGPAPSLSRSSKVDCWKVAVVSSFNNALGGMLTLIGAQLIGVLITDAETVASYKIATTIPFALLFLPSSVMAYAYPYFARNKDNRAWTLRGFGFLVCGMGAMSLAIVAICEVFAEPIVTLIFGAEYLDAVTPFRVLMIGFLVSATLRVPVGNLLVTQRKLYANTLTGVLSIVFNIVMSFALIPSFGMLGAAWVYTLTMALGSLINVPIYLASVRNSRHLRGGVGE